MGPVRVRIRLQVGVPGRAIVTALVKVPQAPRRHLTSPRTGPKSPSQLYRQHLRLRRKKGMIGLGLGLGFGVRVRVRLGSGLGFG